MANKKAKMIMVRPSIRGIQYNFSTGTNDPRKAEGIKILAILRIEELLDLENEDLIKEYEKFKTKINAEDYVKDPIDAAEKKVYKKLLGGVPPSEEVKEKNIKGEFLLKSLYDNFVKQAKLDNLTRSKKNTDDRNRVLLDFVFYLENHEGLKYVEEIKGIHFDEYLVRLMESGSYSDCYGKKGKRRVRVGKGGASAETHNKRRGFLEILIRTLETYYDIKLTIKRKTIPVKKFKREKGIVGKQPFTDEEIKLMMDNLHIAPIPVQDAIMVGLNTGLRLADTVNLKMKHITEEDGIKLIDYTTIKTGERVVMQLSTKLEEYINKRYNISNPYGYLFPDARRFHFGHYAERNIEDKGLDDSYLSKNFTSFLDYLGIKRNQRVNGISQLCTIKSFHSFRHTFCTRLVELDVKERIVMQMMGHEGRKMYLHYSEQAKKITDAKRLGVINSIY